MPGDTAEEVAQEMMDGVGKLFDESVRTGKMFKGAASAAASALKKIGSLASKPPRNAGNAFDDADARAQARGLDGEERTRAAVAEAAGNIPGVDFKPTSSRNVAFDFTTTKRDPKMTMMSNNLHEAGIPFTETYADKEKGIRRFKVHRDHASSVLALVDYLAERVPGFDRGRCVNYDEVAEKLGMARSDKPALVTTVLDHDVLGEEAGREASEAVKEVIGRLGYEFETEFDRTSGEERFSVLVPPGRDFQSDLAKEAARIAKGEALPLKVVPGPSKDEVRVKTSDEAKTRKQLEAARESRKGEKKHRPERDEAQARRLAKEFEHAKEPVLTKKQGR